MRLWSLHPKCLDTKGLLACWRESLLAKKVLEGNTKGYKNHPQLIRFKKLKNPCSASQVPPRREAFGKSFSKKAQARTGGTFGSPCSAVNSYLVAIEAEAESRGYSFDKTKIGEEKFKGKIPVTDGQLSHEFEHLKNKLKTRNPKMFLEFKKIKNPAPHPLFKIVPGKVEEWEKVYDKTN